MKALLAMLLHAFGFSGPTAKPVDRTPQIHAVAQVAHRIAEKDRAVAAAKSAALESLREVGAAADRLKSASGRLPTVLGSIFANQDNRDA